MATTERTAAAGEAISLDWPEGGILENSALLLRARRGVDLVVAKQSPGRRMVMPIKLVSPAFRDGDFIPIEYTSQKGERSPPLEWDGVPEQTKSLAIVLDDTDALGGPRCHWIVYDLPSDGGGIPEHVSHQSYLTPGPKFGVHTRQGRNDFGKIGYLGPLPAKDRPHRYVFTLYALDCILHLPPGVGRGEFLGAVAGRVVDQGTLSCLWSE